MKRELSPSDVFDVSNVIIEGKIPLKLPKLQKKIYSPVPDGRHVCKFIINDNHNNVDVDDIICGNDRKSNKLYCKVHMKIAAEQFHQSKTSSIIKPLIEIHEGDNIHGQCNYGKGAFRCPNINKEDFPYCGYHLKAISEKHMRNNNLKRSRSYSDGTLCGEDDINYDGLLQ